MLKKYTLSLLIVVLTGSILLAFLAQISRTYTDQADQAALEKSLTSQDHWVVPSTRGSAMGLDTIFALRNIKGDSRLISFGTSMTLAGIVEDRFDRIHINASTGSMSIQTLFVMKSYLSSIGIQAQTGDVIKLDLSPVMFTKKDLNLEVLVSALRYQGIYTVNEDLSVKRNALGILGTFYGLNSRAIEKAVMYLGTRLFQGSMDSMYETQANSFDGYEKFLDFSANNTALLEAFIGSFEGQNLVVDLMFMHPDLADSKAGQQFNVFVETTLMPFLQEKGISVLDHRSIYDASDFADSTHLNGKARLNYTALMTQELKELGYE